MRAVTAFLALGRLTSHPRPENGLRTRFRDSQPTINWAAEPPNRTIFRSPRRPRHRQHNPSCQARDGNPGSSTIADLSSETTSIDALGDEHIGKAITDVLTELQEDAETGDPAVKKLTPRAFSARISQRDDWKACRHREGGDKCTRLPVRSARQF